MDTDSSSEELTSSECDTESSCEDDLEHLETSKICGATLQLPQGLCESKEIFKELFSIQTFNSLSEINKQHLKNFLPCFPENDEQEKNVTLQKFFNKEEFRFGSPLFEFHNKLKAGHYRPDIARMRKLMKRVQKKENRHQQRKHCENLVSEVLVSHQKLLDLSYSLPPGVQIRSEKSTTNKICPATLRTKKRYFQELSTINQLVDDSCDFSDDENYPEGPPVQLSRKQKRHLNGLTQNSTQNPSERTVTSTLSYKPGMDLENSITSNYNPYQLNEESYRTILNKHKKLKLENNNLPEYNTKGISVKDIAQRTQLTPKKVNGKPQPLPEPKPIKKKPKIEPKPIPPPIIQSPDIKPPILSSNSDLSDSDSFIDPVMSPVPSKSKRSRTPKPKTTPPRPKPKIEPEIKQEIKTEIVENIPPTISLPQDSITQFSNRLIPATLSDLEGIDMMNLPVDLDDSNIDILDEINTKPELMQDTHANFLSLVRDIICSTMEHRMSLANLEDRLKSWQENPISPLNDWYSFVDNWVSLLPSAIHFLCGDSAEQPEDFVPYMEYKPQLQVYQWIGAGRDNDSLLSGLCQFWLEHRDDSVVQPPIEVEVDILEKPQTPPPPRCPTNWTVRKAEPEEIEEFRRQEQQRYNNPHKAFTYRMNGYESVVGPVKGIYSQSAGVSKARGHSMLNADRPNFVTILTLVRDATARLPNGEGTRADICELLKSSQYISKAAPENVLQSVVSGALDRMHTEYDPCVKYDTKRKIWIYLHRNRTEADFERIHQQCQGMSKHMKKGSRKKATKPKEKTPKATKVTETTTKTTESVPEKTKTFKTPVSRVFTVPTVQNIQVTTQSNMSSVEIPTISPKQVSVGHSLLVNANNQPRTTSIIKPQEKMENVIHEQLNQIEMPNSPEKQIKIVGSTIAPTKQDIEEAIQTFTPIRVASPITKQVSSPKSKSLVKIINNPHGKSLIQPQNSNQQQQTVFIKQIDQKGQTKQLLAQQLLQTISAQQRQIKSPPVVQISQPQKPTIVVSQPLKTIDSKPTVAQPVSSVQGNISQQLLQAINQQKNQQTSNISAAQQQQQMLQTLKQKIAQNPQQTVLTVQQAVLKQNNIQQIQKQLQQQQIAKGTSLLGQQRIITQVGSPKTITSQGTTQTPLVAKVLTNAAGQVISVESLLAHQKQHGTLPQGTTLRVTGKPGQPNLIQIASNAGSQVAQFAVVSQNNIVSVAGQQRIVTTIAPSHTPTQTTQTVVSTAKPLPTIKNNIKPVPTTKIVTSKIAQQFVNAKFIQNVANTKIVPQQKLVVNQNNQIKINTTQKPVTVTKSLITNQNNVRMVNATSLNLAHIGGKPVLLASKGNTIQNLQGQNVIIQSPNIVTSGNLVLPNRVLQQNNIVTQSQITPNNSQVVLGTQLKVQNQNMVQNAPVIVGQSIKQPVNQQQNAVVLGGLKMQGTQQNQRVVLASQGQGGQLVAQQILLPPGFQGGAINIKTLQGLKVIPLAQTQQSKGRPQQVFARIMNPASATRVAQVTTTQATNQMEGTTDQQQMNE